MSDDDEEWFEDFDDMAKDRYRFDVTDYLTYKDRVKELIASIYMQGVRDNGG